MTPDLAREILVQAKATENFEEPIPVDDQEAVKKATEIVEMAELAWKQNIRGPEVEAIINLSKREEYEDVEEEPQAEAPREDSENRSGTSGSITSVKIENSWTKAGTASSSEADQSDSGVSDNQGQGAENSESPQDELGQTTERALPSTDATNDKSGEVESSEQESLDYTSLKLKFEDEVGRTRQHIPAPPSDPIPKLPYDWTQLTEEELQRLYSVFSSLAYYASFCVQKEDRIAIGFKQIADDLARELLLHVDKYDEKKKARTVTSMEQEVEADPNVKKFRSWQRKHEIFAAGHRRERDSYHKLVESLSRVATMRAQDWERSRG